MEQHLTAEIRFSIIPEWITYAKVSDKAVRLYSVLCRFADNQTHEAFPSRETLAEKMMCSTRSVDRATEELIAIDAIIKKQRHNSSLVYIIKVNPTELSTGSDPLVTHVKGGLTPVSRGVDTSGDLTITTQLEPLNLTSLFNEFWSIYPRKMGKGEARGAFAKAIRKHGPEVVMDGVKRLAADPNLPASQFIPRAATWLNQERWTDDPYPEPDLKKIPGIKPAAELPDARGWVKSLHDMGEHFECRVGEFGCK
tara:strand:- start:31 stop:789 length:759 start_codon:yes stop_codon:yes gene_type:complete